MRAQRVLFVGIGGDSYTAGIINDLRNGGYLSFASGVIDMSQNHSEFDEVASYFSQCLFANYDTSNLSISAIDDSLYQSISSVETNLLRQMDRLLYEPAACQLDPPFTGTFDQRRELLFEHLRFWNSKLSQGRFDSVVFHNVPHQVFDSVIYWICKSKGIKTLMFNVVGVFRDTNFISESIEDLGLLALGSNLRESIPEIYDIDHRIFQDWNRVCSQVDDSVGNSLKPSQTYSTLQAILSDGHPSDTRPTRAHLIRALLTRLRRIRGAGAVPSPSLVRRFWRVREVRRSRREEIREVGVGDLPEKFFYFPLHFQPEATTSAKGRHYVELHEVALSVSRALPADVKLVLKEHPHQYKKLLPRPKGFFRRFSEIPNVILVNSDTNSNAIRRRCLGVITVSGSNGFEILASGKAVIAFGSAPWRDAPNVFTIRSQGDVENALEAICNAPRRPRSDYLPFLHRLRQGTIMAELSDSSGGRSESENVMMRKATRINVGGVIRAWMEMSSKITD